MVRETDLNLVDRAILGALGLFLLVLALMVIVTILGWQGIGNLSLALEGLYARPVESFVGAGVFILAGLHLFSLAWKKDTDTTVRQVTEIGHVRISMRAVESLVYRTAKDVRGIKDVEATVVPSPEGVAISLTLIVLPEMSIPQICEEVGHRVRHRVKDSIGIEVSDVGIEIRNISTPARTRVD